MFNTNNCFVLVLQMWVLLLYSGRISGATKRPGFIATFPTRVIANSSAKFCIRFENLPSSEVKFTVEDNEPHIFDRVEKTLANLGSAQVCEDIQIGKVSDEHSVKEIRVSGKSGDYEFSDSKTFTVKVDGHFTLIETDKPVYKPGDKLRIRLLTIDYELKPRKMNFKHVYIIDPSGSRVNQWLDVENPKGLVDLEMPISTEPNLGEWTVEVSDAREIIEKASFKVEKYVLPKFEVTLNHKSKLMSVEGQFEVTACSKYSHGGNVRGTFEVTAYTKRFYSNEKIESITKSENGKACLTFNFTFDELAISSTSYINTIYLEANVAESGTGIKANTSSSIRVLFDSLEIDLDEPLYYKPGFPINIRGVAKSSDEKSTENTKVKVKILKSSVIVEEKETETDKNGRFELNYEPSSCLDKCKANKLTQTPEDFQIDISLVNQPRSNRLFYMKPWTNEKNSNLQIFKLSGKNLFECDEKISANILIRSAVDFDDNIYYQIQARSAILAAGSFNVKSETLKTDGNKQISINFNKKQTKQIPIPDTTAYTFNETKSNRKSICDIQVNNMMNGSKSNKWFYDEATNQCQNLYTGNLDVENKFDSKKECIEQCNFREFYYDLSNSPVRSSKSKNKQGLYEKQLEMSLQLNENMSPQIKILLFAIIDNEIVADLISFRVKKCLSKKVSLSVPNRSLRVSQRAEIRIQTEPNTLCALSAIDKSVSFMGQRNSIEESNVFQKLAQFDLVSDEHNNYESRNENCPNEVPWPRPAPVYRGHVIEKRLSIYRPYFFPRQENYDSNKAFKDGRVLFLSDFFITPECTKKVPIYYAMPRSSFVRKGGPMEMTMRSNSIEYMAPLGKSATLDSIKETSEIEKEPISTIRQYFPETWLWNVEISDEQGVIRRREKAPDSITDWIVDAYCVSNSSGLAISPTKTIKVFQPLFVSVNLPYSVVKDEIFPVKASIFNYEKTCIPVHVQISHNPRLVVVDKKNIQKMCVCPDEEVTAQFSLKAIFFDTENGIRISVDVKSIDEPGICNYTQPITKKIKFSDTEIKNMLVLPEGVPKEHVESSLVILNEKSLIQNQTFNMSIPTNIVPKSLRVHLVVIGDSMGSILNNLDNLVRQPTGCGEQNMVKFAPIVSVSRYLITTYQMTPKLRNLTEEYLKIGYQRQLTYRHSDHSFSAFGPSHTAEGGGTWLTAFVLRTFADTYVLNTVKLDKNDIVSSFQMLMGTQDTDGSFKQVGAPLLSKALSGGLNDKKAALSAYVLVSLLKSINLVDNKQQYSQNIDKALAYLKNSVNNLQQADTYTLAVVLYAFKLAQFTEDDLINRIDQHLDNIAIRKNGFMYWKESKDENETKSKNSYWMENQSADLEITAYILLAKLSNFQQRDLSKIIEISKWINSQRNSLGGFYSTQDTVVALDALAEFARISYAKNISLKLNYELNSMRNVVFVNELNRLLVQKVKLDKFDEKGQNTFNFELSGFGTALVQVVFKYNILNDDVKFQPLNDFEFSVFSSSLGYSDCSKSKLNIKARYVGAKNSSSMAIVNIRLPSGWEAIKDSIEKLTTQVDLKRFEIDQNKINLYFDQLTSAWKEFDIEVVKTYDIQNTKPGLVTVYDYYEPLDDVVTQPFEISKDCN